MSRIEYVAGLMFTEDRTHLALIQKKKPDWQRNRLNAIGGKVEPGEIPLFAMVREFAEETGVETSAEDWTPLVELTGKDWVVYFYRAFSDAAWNVRTLTEEEVYVGAVGGFLANQFLMDNLKSIIPLALDRSGINLPVAMVDGTALTAATVDPERFDPRTGRPMGDHGTALDAINFALDTSQGLECEDFLRAWREGDLEEWPDFYEWFAAREAEPAKAAA